MDLTIEELLKWPSPCCEEDFKFVDIGLECKRCNMVYFSSFHALKEAERISKNG